MKEVDFDALNIHVSHGPARLQHHFMALLRKPVNNVSAYANIAFAQLFNCIKIAFGVMGTVNELRGGLMNCLQAHLHP
ncbi:hypothetical protein D3C81_1863910 [compost metagenome]